MFKTIRQKVKELLILYPDLRNSDKKLVWTYWNIHNECINDSTLYEDDFISQVTDYTSICRQARLLRSKYPEFKGSAEVQRQRAERENEYRDEFATKPKEDAGETRRKIREKYKLGEYKEEENE